MAISKERKRELIELYVDHLQHSQGVVLTEYRGMSMGQLTELRGKLRDVGGRFVITKNTLFKLALRECDMGVPDDLLLGPVATAFADEDIAGTAKALLELSKDDASMLVVKGGIVGQSVFDLDELEKLTELPSMDVLRAQLLGLVTSPATGLVSLLEASARDVVGVLDAASSQVLNVVAAYADKADAEQEAA